MIHTRSSRDTTDTNPTARSHERNVMPHQSEWRTHLTANLKTIRDSMDEKGLTSSQLAKTLGVHPSLLNKILAGTYTPPLFLTLMMADTLGLTYFMGKLYRSH